MEVAFILISDLGVLELVSPFASFTGTKNLRSVEPSMRTQKAAKPC